MFGVVYNLINCNLNNLVLAPTPVEMAISVDYEADDHIIMCSFANLLIEVLTNDPRKFNFYTEALLKGMLSNSSQCQISLTAQKCQSTEFFCSLHLPIFQLNSKI